MIKFSNVDLGYKKKTLLHQINCEIQEGDYVGLVGPNGSGKTTFLRGVLNLILPQRGQIEVNRRKTFAYVPQVDDVNLLWPLTVRETVSLANKSRRVMARLTPHEKEAIIESLEETDMMRYSDHLFSELSGGQRQRVILAQALSQQPDVLLLDEPTRGLDVVVEQDFLQLIETLRKNKHLTILFVTHSLQIPLNFAQKILLFKNGTVVSTKPKHLIKTNQLDDLYGVPFDYLEKGTTRWVTPQRKKS